MQQLATASCKLQHLLYLDDDMCLCVVGAVLPAAVKSQSRTLRQAAAVLLGPVHLRLRSPCLDSCRDCIHVDTPRSPCTPRLLS